MKKLMIAAMAACTVGTLFASNCEVLDEHVCTYAYRIKLAGKTVKGKEKAATSACSTGACWAKPASLRIAGYIYNAGTEASFWEAEDSNSSQENSEASCMSFFVHFKDALFSLGNKNYGFSIRCIEDSED